MISRQILGSVQQKDKKSLKVHTPYTSDLQVQTGTETKSTSFLTLHGFTCHINIRKKNLKKTNF